MYASEVRGTGTQDGLEWDTAYLRLEVRVVRQDHLERLTSTQIHFSDMFAVLRSISRQVEALALLPPCPLT